MKFKQYDQTQQMLFPPEITSMIPENHLARFINTIIEQLDLESLYESYSEEGQPGYHPKLLLKIIVYGYTTGVRSSRKIAEKLISDVCFMYLSGMQRPDFRTISDFRLQKREYFQKYFIEILRLSKKLGMYSLGHVSIDGSKIKANASKDSLYDKEGLLGYEQKVKEIIQEAEELDKQEDKKYGDKGGHELPEEINTTKKLLEKIKEAKQKIITEDKSRISLTDTDSNLMKTSNGGTDLCYNAQIAVDSDNQLIVAYEAEQEENDIHLFPMMYEKVVQNNEETPKEVSADAGYFCGLTYNYIEDSQIDAYLPDKKFAQEVNDDGTENLSKYHRTKFIKQEGKNAYICPEGKPMKHHERSIKRGIKQNTYRGTGCHQCSVREECVTIEGAKYRYIHIYENDEFREQMRQKLKTKRGRAKYLIRLKTVEPVFAQLKHIMNFKQFLLRGREKVRAELSLICTCYNLKKIKTLMSNRKLAMDF